MLAGRPYGINLRKMRKPRQGSEFDSYFLHTNKEKLFKEIRELVRLENNKNKIDALLNFVLPVCIILFLPFLLAYFVQSDVLIKLNYFVFTFGVTFFSVFTLWKAKNEGDLALTRIDEKIHEINQKTTDSFRDLIEPLFETFDDKHQLRELLVRVAKSLTDDRSPKKEFIYIGGASVYPTDEEIFQYESEDAEKYQIAIEYKRIFEEIVNDSSIRMLRYFQPFDPETFNTSKRAVELVDGYRQWLINQKNLIQRSGGNYQLLRSPRSPTWGAAKSTIITNSFVVDIYAGARGGTSIRSRSISRQQKTKIVDDFVNGGKSAAEPLGVSDVDALIEKLS